MRRVPRVMALPRRRSTARRAATVRTVAAQDVPGPVARMRPGELRVEELPLGLPQRRGFRLGPREREVELLHELRAGAVDDIPAGRDRRGRARRQQGPAEALHALAADHLAALRLARRQRHELHAAEVEVVDLAQEQVVRRARRAPRARAGCATGRDRACPRSRAWRSAAAARSASPAGGSASGRPRPRCNSARPGRTSAMARTSSSA